MNLADTAAILKRLSETYGKPISEAQARGYHMVLGRRPRLLVAAATLTVMGACKFLPTPAEINQAVEAELERGWQPLIETFDEVCAWLMFLNGYASPDELTEADIRRANLAAYGVERPGSEHLPSAAELAAAMQRIISESADRMMSSAELAAAMQVSKH